MMRIVVCDDDKSDRENLNSLIREYEGGAKKHFDVRMFESGQQLLDSRFMPNIVFLDIIMGGRDGIEVGREIRKRDANAIIIYVTCLEGRIADAVNGIHSFGYLVKPIAREEFANIFDDAIILADKSHRGSYETFLSVHNTIITLSVNDIYYFEYSNRKVKIVMRDEWCIFVKEKINDIADRMRRYGFEMAHQSFVVNLYEVKEIRQNMLLMKNGDMVYLAQKRASTIRSRIMEMIRESYSD